MHMLPAQSWRDMFMHPRQFDTDEMEKSFLSHYCAKFATNRRNAILLGAFIWICFIGWDVYHGTHDPLFGKVLAQMVGWRIAGFLFLLVMTGMTLMDRFSASETFAARLLQVASIGLYSISFWMMYLTPFPYDYLFYFMAFLIIMVFGFSVLRLRAPSTTWLMTVYVLSTMVGLQVNFYEKLDQLVRPADLVYMGSAMAFVLAMALMGYIVGIQNERAERAAFQSENTLQRYNDIILKRNQEVENLNQALEHSNRETAQKSSALMEIKDKMRIEAERQNQEKSHFLASAVHDLRQPIQAISNALEPLKHSIGKNDLNLTNMLIDLAQDASDLMRHQLSAILEISRLESGYARPELESFDLQQLVESIVVQLMPMAQAEDVNLVFVPNSDAVAVRSDKVFLGRMLSNIIANGVKYHNPKCEGGSFVQVKVESLAAYVNIEIQDNGIGIPNEYLQNGAIFKPFFQLHSGRGANEKGVGLGLSIVNAMLALLPEHRLEVQSVLNAGTTFSLEVPRSALVAQSPQRHVAAMPISRTVDVHGKYILFVEDDASVLVTTMALLVNHGFLVEGVSSLVELATLLPTLERVPDLVLSDYRLPDGKTAIDVVRLVNENFGSLPTLILTADQLDRDGASVGLSVPVLRKPVSTHDLLTAITEMVSASDLEGPAE